MTDYEKLKAFAEELVPGCMSREKDWEHNGQDFMCTDYNDGEFSIRGYDKVHVSIMPDGEYDLYKPENLDQWINETREYWREQGLPSLQKGRGHHITDPRHKYTVADVFDTKDFMCKPKGCTEGINNIKPKSIMKNIKDTLKALTHSKDDKALIKAELKNEELKWSREAWDFADELILEERMATKEFKEQMLKVAEERNKECK